MGDEGYTRELDRGEARDRELDGRIRALESILAAHAVRLDHADAELEHRRADVRDLYARLGALAVRLAALAALAAAAGTGAAQLLGG